MTTCTAPRCSAPARWRVTGQDRVVCGDHIPDSTPVEALPPEGILAAWCPEGWRRDTAGRPVLPCLGAMMGRRNLPPLEEVSRQLAQLDEPPPGDATYRREITPLYDLVRAVVIDTWWQQHRGGDGISQLVERAVSGAIEAICRRRGTVRIVREGNGWREVSDG